MAKEIQSYELTYVASPRLSEDQAASLQEDIRVLLGSHDAEIESWDSPKRRRLAYLVHDENEAYLGSLHFTAAPDRAVKIERAIGSQKNILRSLVTKWQKPHLRQRLFTQKPLRQVEEQVPTDEKALDEKLEEILGNTPQ